MISIPPALQPVFSGTRELQNAYLVGGCVRDALLGLPCKDIDIEVFGVGYEQLVKALSRWGKTDLVGRSFGVVKLRVGENVFDFTIPRRDSKVAPGHKGFEIEFDPALTPEKAASRRDFTINSLMFDPRAQTVLDFFGGVSDLEKKILRHTGSAFEEDPLRVLRGMQFAARFDLQATPETIALCRKIKSSYGELAVERVREEWFKWAEKSSVPSRGLKFLVETEWVEHFPEIQSLIGVPQEPDWHPEGDVFIHTCHCCDAMVNLPEWKSAESETRIVYSLAILAHDFGKPATTHREMKNGVERIVSPGHDEVGGALTENFLERIAAPNVIRERVVPLVKNHLAHFDELSDRAVRRLAKRLAPENIRSLCTVMIADQFGRPPRPQMVSENVTRLLQRSHELEIQIKPPSPILLGRHLIELGMSAGKEMGKVLHAAFDAQLEGNFFDLPQAMDWLRNQKEIELPANVREKLRKR
ncbi:MAG: polynucleotide adenylyltransferase [Verrucomicrobiota bacterium]